MDIKVISQTETRIRFVVSNASPSLVNSLRRCLMTEIPKMAIELVEFHLGPIMDEEGNEYEILRMQTLWKYYRLCKKQRCSGYVLRRKDERTGSRKR